MSENADPETNIAPVIIESKHQTAINRMMEKPNQKIGGYVESRDMHPWMIVTDFAKTAGYVGIVYGAITLVTGEPKLSMPITNSVLNLLQGESGIIGGITLIKAAEKTINSQGTSLDTNSMMENIHKKTDKAINN